MHKITHQTLYSNNKLHLINLIVLNFQPNEWDEEKRIRKTYREWKLIPKQRCRNHKLYKNEMKVSSKMRKFFGKKKSIVSVIVTMAQTWQCVHNTLLLLHSYRSVMNFGCMANGAKDGKQNMCIGHQANAVSHGRNRPN